LALKKTIIKTINFQTVKKALIILFLALPVLNTYGQFYHPNGKKINTKGKTIAAVLDSLGVSETNTHSRSNGEVYFKRLSNKPVLLLLDPKTNPLKIKEIINSYDYAAYLNSYSYYFDLTDMIKEQKLTKEYLIDVFGNPVEVGTNSDGNVEWFYKNQNLIVTFEEEYAKSVKVMNYNAIGKHDLMIIKHEVTGSDYGIGFNIAFMNLSEKAIKYFYITVSVSNAVRDKIATKTVRGIGPVEKDDTGFYEFENIVYSRLAKYLTLESVKVLYMDGTIKIIPKKEVQYIRMWDWEAEGNRTAD